MDLHSIRMKETTFDGKLKRRYGTFFISFISGTRRAFHATMVSLRLVVLVVLVVATLLGPHTYVCGQAGGYVVRGKARVIEGDTIMVDGTEVTLSGVALAQGYESMAKTALAKRIGSRSVGCMVDGAWSGKNWGYCGDPTKKQSRDIRKTLNAWLVRTGNALSDDAWGLFDREEAQAKRKKKGLWKV